MEPRRDGSETEDPWAAAAAAAHAMAMAAQTLARAGLEICVATARIALLCAGEMLTAAWVWAATMAQRAQREASQMSEAGAAALAERVSEIASHPDAVPCSGMFAATFLTLCFCRAVSVTAVPHILLAAVAAAIAVPSTAAVAVDIAARASDLVSTALRHPQLEAAAASVAEALQHPHAERATAMLGAAHNSSAALAARAYAAALSHPHLQPLLEAANAHLEAAIAHPHVAATRNHAHWGRLAGWLGPLCLGAMLLGLLRCTVCSSCRRRGGTESAAPACSAAAAAAAAEAKAAKRERQRAKREAAAKLAAKRKKRGGVVTGEGELRLEDEPASSRIRLASVAGLLLLPLRLVRWAAAAAVAVPSQLLRLRPADEGEGEGEGEEESDGETSAVALAAAKGPEAARPRKRPTPPPLSHPRLLCTLKGFSEGVTGAALSQDGALAAAVSSDRTLRVFSGLRQAGSGDPQRVPLVLSWTAPRLLLVAPRRSAADAAHRQRPPGLWHGMLHLCQRAQRPRRDGRRPPPPRLLALAQAAAASGVRRGGGAPRAAERRDFGAKLAVHSDGRLGGRPQVRPHPRPAPAPPPACLTLALPPLPRRTASASGRSRARWSRARRPSRRPSWARPSPRTRSSWPSRRRRSSRRAARSRCGTAKCRSLRWWRAAEEAATRPSPPA